MHVLTKAKERIVGAWTAGVSYLSDVNAELKRVSWPARREVYGTTLVVIIAVFFFGFYLFIVDIVLNYGMSKLLQFFGVR
ncbi:MAG: preprotein translocase subunit SecE [Acidobacteria bacterium]|nr:preprotein translocase subunit SecE [Acidobacteriota bacterium]